MTSIGIMQGRLVPPEDLRIQSFPRESWAEEFELAALAELDALEWIYDVYGADLNPLATDNGVAQIKELSVRHGVTVNSLCADYFMENPLIRANSRELHERLDMLIWLLGRCQCLGMQRIVLPFVDASEIRTDSELDQAVEVLGRVLPAAHEGAIEIHLETSLSPVRFAELLDRLPDPYLKVNYDTGNSASLGYLPRDEFTAYGQRVGSVHIKDRVLAGGSVPLGTGHVDFAAVFDNLRALRYSGDFILQVARHAPGDEVAWAKRNRAFIKERWPEIRKA